MILAMIGVWYNNFFGAETQTLLPYDQVCYSFNMSLLNMTSLISIPTISKPINKKLCNWFFISLWRQWKRCRKMFMYIGICACVDESIRTVSHNYTFFGINHWSPSYQIGCACKIALQSYILCW